ncbi:polysaccharide deacetylase family protein [Haoranjiania flava]|uniref:Polysaccharide deacetylase family protein n=1 Tax=Haoranjiania flava TaxID=1856322 RepID=A0AAE3IPW4_9BACT|nr:polysaccharide deacetylase family protein [Haoranjiania flava]MCU7695210.1 polysaccharide deacetylase family protein [Haoranjiania flava]
MINTLQKAEIKASFFLTGNFYANPAFAPAIKKLKLQGHYLGAHSDKHLLYNDWQNRDSLLVTKEEFTKDLLANYAKMKAFGIEKKEALYFLPPYEWYNRAIAGWTDEMGLTLVNFTPGTLSHADYTTPDAKNYRSSAVIFDNIIAYENANKMNGFILLSHIGSNPQRTDKFYTYLPKLITYLKNKGYRFVKIDELLREAGK